MGQGQTFECKCGARVFETTMRCNTEHGDPHSCDGKSYRAEGYRAAVERIAEWCGEQEGQHMKAECLTKFGKVAE